MSAKALRIYFSVCGLGLLLFLAFAYRPTVVLGVDGKTLGDSLNGEITSGGDVEPCTKAGEAWHCTLTQPSGGNTNYVVTADDWGCWEARQSNGASSGAGADAAVDGCITLLDH